MSNLPNWPSASAVYSKAYRVLERMAERGHATPGSTYKTRTGKTVTVTQGHVSDDMARLIDALNAGDEETIKGLLLLTWIYPTA